MEGDKRGHGERRGDCIVNAPVKLKGQMRPLEKGEGKGYEGREVRVRHVM